MSSLDGLLSQASANGRANESAVIEARNANAFTAKSDFQNRISELEKNGASWRSSRQGGEYFWVPETAASSIQAALLSLLKKVDPECMNNYTLGYKSETAEFGGKLYYVYVPMSGGLQLHRIEKVSGAEDVSDEELAVFMQLNSQVSQNRYTSAAERRSQKKAS